MAEDCTESSSGRMVGYSEGNFLGGPPPARIPLRTPAVAVDGPRAGGAKRVIPPNPGSRKSSPVPTAPRAFRLRDGIPVK